MKFITHLLPIAALTMSGFCTFNRGMYSNTKHLYMSRLCKYVTSEVKVASRYQPRECSHHYFLGVSAYYYAHCIG